MPSHYEYESGFEEQDPLMDYLRTMHYGLEGIIADQGAEFEAYLDGMNPQTHVDEMLNDFQRRYYGTFQTKHEVIASVLGPSYLDNHSEADLWEHIETIYEVVWRSDGQIYLFVPDTTGGRHG